MQPVPNDLLPIRRAAKAIGVQYRQLLNAVNEKLVPHYKLRKSRMLVSVSEVISIMRSGNGSKAVSND